MVAVAALVMIQRARVRMIDKRARSNMWKSSNFIRFNSGVQKGAGCVFERKKSAGVCGSWPSWMVLTQNQFRGNWTNCLLCSDYSSILFILSDFPKLSITLLIYCQFTLLLALSPATAMSITRCNAERVIPMSLRDLEDLETSSESD